jgi:hypothetical protein
MPATAVRTAISPGHSRPSGPKVCAQSGHWYAFLSSQDHEALLIARSEPHPLRLRCPLGCLAGWAPRSVSGLAGGLRRRLAAGRGDRHRERPARGMCARRTRSGLGGGRAAATVALCPGHETRRLHRPTARCGGWPAVRRQGRRGLGRSLGSAVNPGRLLIVLEASRDARHPIAAASGGHHESDAPYAGMLPRFALVGAIGAGAASTTVLTPPLLRHLPPWTCGCSVIHIRAPRKHGWPPARAFLASRPVDATITGRPRR